MPPNTKPLIGFGQDERIFKQCLFASNAWTAPDGQMPVIPKDEGLGVMPSTFVSQESGFGMKLSLQGLNKSMSRDKVNAAATGQRQPRREVRWRQLLESSPFVVEFKHVIHEKGCWLHCHMVL
jgi:hypothetical protein